MVSIIFKKEGKADRVVNADEGISVMEAALSNGIEEILADCGGSLSCATCHVYVAPEWVERVGPPKEEELAMLEMAVDTTEASRLSCQIKLSSALEGMELILPKSQL